MYKIDNIITLKWLGWAFVVISLHRLLVLIDNYALLKESLLVGFLVVVASMWWFKLCNTLMVSSND